MGGREGAGGRASGVVLQGAAVGVDELGERDARLGELGVRG